MAVHLMKVEINFMTNKRPYFTKVFFFIINSFTRFSTLKNVFHAKKNI